MKWLSTRPKIALMVAPGLVLYTLFLIYPVVYSLAFSFTDFSGFGQPEFVGADNYRALADDPLVASSLVNTLIILVISLVVLIPAGFLLALLLQRRVRAANVQRAFLFAPNIIAPILIGLIWVFILDPKLGLINIALRNAGLEDPPLWIGGPTLTPFSVAIVYCWSVLGFTMTIFFAGLQALPSDVIEASAIDGATRTQQVLLVIVPLMKTTFAIVAVLTFTGALRIFELVYQLTGGGPVHTSDVLVSYMYYITFTVQRYGPGMALAVVITLLGAVAAVIYVAATRERALR